MYIATCICVDQYISSYIMLSWKLERSKRVKWERVGGTPGNQRAGIVIKQDMENVFSIGHVSVFIYTNNASFPYGRNMMHYYYE